MEKIRYTQQAMAAQREYLKELAKKNQVIGWLIIFQEG